MKYLDYVNVRMGTDTSPRFSNGNTLPMTSLPFGMNNFLVETRGHNPLEIFNADDRITTGIRLTHCSNRWLGDYGFLTFMPRSEGSKSGICSPSSFVPEKTVMNPHELKVNFQIQRAEVSLAPAQRSAAVKVHYEYAEGGRSLLLKLFGGAEIAVNQDGTVTGKVCNHFNEVPENFGIYFAISFDKSIDAQKTDFYTHHGEKIAAAGVCAGENIFADIALEGRPDDFEMRIATSFISVGQARQNLKEIDGKSYDDVKALAAEKWEEILGRIEIEADEEVKKTFYSCLYRKLCSAKVPGDLPVPGCLQEDERRHRHELRRDLCHGNGDSRHLADLHLPAEAERSGLSPDPGLYPHHRGSGPARGNRAQTVRAPAAQGAGDLSAADYHQLRRAGRCVAQYASGVQPD